MSHVIETRPRASVLEVSLLGRFQLRFEQSVLPLPSRKCQALFAYLAFSPGQTHTREQLQALLWPEAGKAQAQASLRQALLTLRRSLPPPIAASMRGDGSQLALDPAQLEVDVWALRAQLASTTPEALARIAALCPGPLLEGFSLGEHAFDSWLESERARLIERVVAALERLTAHEAGSGELSRAIETASHALHLDPLQERLHRRLMRLYADSGRRSDALTQYQRCAASLRAELGVDPEPETEQLQRDLVRAFSAPPLPVHPTRAVVTHTNLTGRHAELSALDRAREQAWAGTSRLTLLHGDAGIGKTSLLNAASARALACGGRSLRGRCFESEQVLPFALFVDLVQSDPLFTDQEIWQRLAPAGRAELSRVLPFASADPAWTRAPHDPRRLFEAFAELLSRVAERGPLLITLDDLQWVDALSLRLLSWLVRRLPDAARVCWLASVRAEALSCAAPELLPAIMRELEREQALLRLEVLPLSAADTRALATRLSRDRGTALAAAMFDRIWAISEGNPWVVVETIQQLCVSNHALAPNTGVETLAVPERVRELIVAHTAALAAPAKQLLATAAVIGRECEFAWLARATGLPAHDVVSALEQLVQLGLLQSAGDGLYFTHDRVREVVYASLLPARRRLLHVAIARASEALHAPSNEAAAGPIGYHFARGGEAAASVVYLTRFAERAELNYGLTEALAALAEAQLQSGLLPAETRETITIELTIRRARCLFFAGRVAEMEPALAPHLASVQRLDSASLSAPYYVYLAMAHAYIGDRRGVAEHEPHLIAAAERCSDITVAGMAYAQLSYNALRAGQFARCLDYGRQALSRLEAGRDPELTAIAWMNIGASQVFTGACRIALEYFQFAAGIGEQIGSARVRSMAAAFSGSAWTLIGEFGSGLAACRAALPLAPDPYSARYAHWAFVRCSVAIASLGAETGLSVLDDMFHASLAELEAVAETDPGFAGFARVALSEAALVLSDPERAYTQASAALKLVSDYADPMAVGWSLRALGNAALARGDLECAAERLHAARALFDSVGARLDVASTTLALAALAGARGDLAAASAGVRTAHACYGELELPYWTTLVERAAGAFGIAI